MSAKPSAANHPGPKAWMKNTYFWISLILFVLGIVGIVGGDKVIRDPGQIHEDKLWMIYLGASVLMLINGLISHRAYMAQWDDIEEGETN